jgi:GR25 family glycosyltransferase involved in LPS biosynthesis
MLNLPLYCINLIDRKDRKEYVKEEFKKININYLDVNFPLFTKDVRGGKYGCYNSHVKVWKDFYENSNSNYCLIFEDDFVTNENCKNIIEKGEEFIKNNYTEVDFLLLHNLYSKLPSKLNSNYFERGMSTDLHAYFISRNYIKLLIDKSNYNWLNFNRVALDLAVNFDRKHILYSKKCYYSKQESFTQLLITNSPSDISNNFIDFISRLPLLKWYNVYITTFFMKINLFNEDEWKDKFIAENINLENII